MHLLTLRDGDFRAMRARTVALASRIRSRTAPSATGTRIAASPKSNRRVRNGSG